MYFSYYKILFLSIMICLPVLCLSQAKDSITALSILKSSQFDGVIKTKMETSTDAGTVRFNVRNSRIGVRGYIGNYLNYRVQVELSNEGVFSPLDLFGTLKVSKKISLQFGQLHIPFENGYIITPAEMIFANRAFVGKYFTPGSRDIGASVQYKLYAGAFPLEVAAGMFNGGKINNPQWTDKPSYALRLIAGSMDGFRTSVKIYKYNSEQLDLYLWGADIHYSYNRFRIEAEAINRNSITKGLALFGTYIQGAYSFNVNIANMFHNLTTAIRWDSMGYNVLSGGMDVNRITIGLNFGLTFIPCESVLRFDYEQYFLRDGIEFPDFDNRDPHVADNKLTVELVVKF